jgi:hypothetical protein
MATKVHSVEEKAVRRYRDTTTGRFVTRKHAKKNKKTTIKERMIRAAA